MDQQRNPNNELLRAHLVTPWLMIGYTWDDAERDFQRQAKKNRPPSLRWYQSLVTLRAPFPEANFPEANFPELTIVVNEPGCNGVVIKGPPHAKVRLNFGKSPSNFPIPDYNYPDFVLRFDRIVAAYQARRPGPVTIHFMSANAEDALFETDSDADHHLVGDGIVHWTGISMRTHLPAEFNTWRWEVV